MHHHDAIEFRPIEMHYMTMDFCRICDGSSLIANRPTLRSSNCNTCNEVGVFWSHCRTSNVTVHVSYMRCFNFKMPHICDITGSNEEMEDQRLENTKKYERKETRRDMMARKRLQLRQLFARELIEQEKLLRELGYSFINTHH